jgi:hypothetical protein
VESELEGSKGGNEDEEDEVDGDVANTLPHASRRHLDPGRRDVVFRRMSCIQEEGISSTSMSREGEQGSVYPSAC